MKANPFHPRAGGIVGDVAGVLPRLPKYAKLTWLLLKDPSLTARQRTVLTVAVGYSVSPIDAIPGFIPVIGQLDDLAMLLFGIRWVLRRMPQDRAQSYLNQSSVTQEQLDDDFHLVRRSGAKVLRKTVALLGTAALAAWGIGKYAGKGIAREIRERTRKR